MSCNRRDFVVASGAALAACKLPAQVQAADRKPPAEQRLSDIAEELLVDYPESATMLGIDTVAVYANDRFLASHIFFTTHVYRQNSAARFDTLDLRGVMDLDLMEASESMVAASGPQ